MFTDVDQTVPLGSFASANGAAATNSQLDVPSVINGMVFDTLAVGMGTIAVNGPQVSQWNVTSGGANPNASQDIVGTASSRTGAPSVPLSETFNETLNLTSVVPDAATFNLTSIAPSTTTFNLSSVTPTKVVLTLSKAANATGGTTVYTGTFAAGTYVGDTVVVAGFTTGANNGTFICTASSANSITLNNAAGVAQTHAGTATVTVSTVYTGTITGGAGNAFAGDNVIVAGFTTAANNGTFVATASTATTLTLSNAASVAETNPGTAKIATAVYTGTITGGAANAFLGDNVVISGFTKATNNGTFVAIASSATTLTLNNTAAVAETDPAIAAVDNGSSTSTDYTGTITGGFGNGFAGDSFVIAGFTNAANNGTFTCTASTGTTLTCSNAAGVKETHAGTAITNSTFNWSEGAVSINPSTADIVVTTSVASAIFLGSSTTYNITVTNNGPSAYYLYSPDPICQRSNSDRCGHGDGQRFRFVRQYGDRH